MTRPPLAPWERGILDRLIDGKLMQQTARELGLKYQTIRHHLVAARERVQANTTYQLVAMYAREGR
jgi:DNA-binding CsgD family transcriptional regulator